MTDYMPILPIGMLGLFDICNVTDAFILPQFWSNETYRTFYTSRMWDRVIIDNALYENPDAVRMDDLIAIAEEIDSIQTFIVGPEKIGDGAVTTSLMLNAIAEHGPSGHKWILMSVFQGTPAEMFHMFDSLKEYRIGFAIPVSMFRQGWSRAGLKFFTGVGTHYVHALGLDDVTEIPDLVRAGINSFDSSIVASAAVNGIDLFGTDLRVIRTGSPNDPVRVNLLHTTFHQDVIDTTASNIDDLNSIVGTVKIEAKQWNTKLQ